MKTAMDHELKAKFQATIAKTFKASGPGGLFKSPTRILFGTSRSPDQEHDAGGIKERRAEAIVASKSLASRRLRLIQAKKRSTTPQRGRIWKPT
jgi:hypothetical protein